MTVHEQSKNFKILTIFLFGQARHPSANKYLVNDVAILTRRSCTRKPDRLLLRSYVEGEMGFDSILLLKAHDDLFVKPFTLIAQLRSSQRRKVSFIWETVFQSKNIQEGRGSGRCHTEL